METIDIPRQWFELREECPNLYNFLGINLSLLRKIRQSRQNANWIKYCLERDNHACHRCGKQGTEVHHKKPLFIIMIQHRIETISEALACKPLFDKRNGVTVCKKCHRLEEPYYDQRGEDETIIVALDRKTWKIRYTLRMPYYYY